MGQVEADPVGIGARLFHHGAPGFNLHHVVEHFDQRGQLAQRGRQGGIRLLESPSRISVLRIVTTVDPKGTRINACTSSGGCLRRLECPTYPPLRRLQERLDRGLAKLTLDKFVGGRSVK